MVEKLLFIEVIITNLTHFKNSTKSVIISETVVPTKIHEILLIFVVISNIYGVNNRLHKWL